MEKPTLTERREGTLLVFTADGHYGTRHIRHYMVDDNPVGNPPIYVVLRGSVQFRVGQKKPSGVPVDYATTLDRAQDLAYKLAKDHLGNWGEDLTSRATNSKKR